MLFRSDLDLCSQSQVASFFKDERIDHVILAAAKVGGVWSNAIEPADYIYQNLMIESNVIHAAYQYRVQSLLFLGSSCIYPKHAPQPISESALLQGELEKTNEAYAIAKIAGLKLCEFYNQQYNTRFIAVMPTNLYGPGDQYDPTHSHVMAALIRKVHQAKVNGKKNITIWGTGTPKREFLYVDDLAEACLFLMTRASCPDLVNIGVGKELSILDLVHVISEVLAHPVSVTHDLDKPDGTMQKRLDVSKMTELGWEATTSLKEGIALAYADFLEQETRS